MLQARRPAAININIANMHKLQASPTTTQRDFSPLRRRRTKIQRSTKTNEDLIRQSHEMLMGFVDSLDDQVKHLVDNNQAQFLIAYRQHSAKVKEEMKEIKKQMLENAHNQQQYLDRIKYLEKELIIFREETLKMSQKLILKNQQIENLKIKIKQMFNENRQQKAHITELTRTGMTLTARLQMKDQSVNNESLLAGDKTNFPTNRGLNDSYKFIDQTSPINLHLKSYTAQMRTRSIKKDEKITDSKLISSTIQEKPNQAASRSNKPNQIQHQKTQTLKSELSCEKKRSLLKNRLEKSRAIETEIEKMKSKSFAEKNQYQRIFIECVDEVRKDIMRRGYADSLNYFKENGPKSLIQFKRLDHYAILELFLKREAVNKKMFELLFHSETK